jgi:hypothetical protein
MGTVVHFCNLSSVGGGYPEHHNSKAAQANISRDPISKIPNTHKQICSLHILYFHMNFGILLLISNKNTVGFWLTSHWIVIHIYVNIYLRAHTYRFVYIKIWREYASHIESSLFISVFSFISLIFFSNLLNFSVYRSCTSCLKECWYMLL